MKTCFLVIVIAALVACSSAKDVRMVKDVRYADRSDRNVLDIYIPAGAKNPPLVVWIHGGKFMTGDKKDLVGLNNFLNAGIAVASINYRFSHEAVWPAQLEDLRDAFAFLRAQATNYGYDANRIASFGASAGGYLSAMAGIALADDSRTRLTACILWFPPIDFSTMDKDIEKSGVKRATGRNDAPDSPESALIGATVKKNPQLARAASPITYLENLPAGTRLPAFLIMHGDKDPFIASAQSRRLFSALATRSNIGSLEYILYPEGGHGTGDFQKPEAIEKVVSFLKANFT